MIALILIAISSVVGKAVVERSVAAWAVRATHLARALLIMSVVEL